jgi:hypothetical protein
LTRKSGVVVREDSTLVLEVDNSSFGVLKSKSYLRKFSSASIKLSGEVINGSRKLSVLVGKNGNLIGQVGNGGFSIGKSSLESRALSSKSIVLSG